MYGSQPKIAPRPGTNTVTAAIGTVRAATEPQIPLITNDAGDTSAKQEISSQL
jgi:hypothetical protein